MYTSQHRYFIVNRLIMLRFIFVYLVKLLVDVLMQS